MIDPSNLTNEELREQFARMLEERERTTPGWHEAILENCWAICTDPMCEGSAEPQPVRGIRQTHTVTFGAVDGDTSGPFANTISHTTTHLRFADPADLRCPHCEVVEHRMITDQKRPTYVSVIGGQDALLRVRKAEIAGPPDAQAVLLAAEQAKAKAETPIEALQRRYVNGEIEDAEYAQKLAAIGQPVPALLRPAPKPKPKPAVEPEPKAA